MAPKAPTSSPLGPLARRTFKGSGISTALPLSNTGAGVGTSGASASSPSRGTSPAGPSSSPSSSSKSLSTSRAYSPPHLLPRNEETSLHRRLRSLLLEFARCRRIWEDEVVEMAEAVGSYASVVGDLEEELAEESQRGRARREDGRKAKSKRGGGGGGKTEENYASFSSPAIPEAFRSLHEIYTRSLVKGQERIQRATQALVRCKDSARSLQAEWVRLGDEAGLGVGSAGEDIDGVRWGRRGGDEFVEAISHLTLQVQIQTVELLQSLDKLLIDCSPLGSLHVLSDHSASSEIASYVSTQGERQTAYDPRTSSSQRKEILLLWRDLPSLDRGGEASFEWWEDVWRSEVRGWEDA